MGAKKNYLALYPFTRWISGLILIYISRERDREERFAFLFTAQSNAQSKFAFSNTRKLQYLKLNYCVFTKIFSLWHIFS